MRERKPNEEVAFIREAYGLRAALFFPVHRDVRSSSGRA